MYRKPLYKNLFKISECYLPDPLFCRNEFKFKQYFVILFAHIYPRNGIICNESVPTQLNNNSP